MDFPAKWAQGKKSPAPAAGPNFLAAAKEDLAHLFAAYAEREDFDSFQAFMDSLQSDTWAVVEQFLKQSYRNGLGRGQSRYRTSRR